MKCKTCDLPEGTDAGQCGAKMGTGESACLRRALASRDGEIAALKTTMKRVGSAIDNAMGDEWDDEAAAIASLAASHVREIDHGIAMTIERDDLRAVGAAWAGEIVDWIGDFKARVADAVRSEWSKRDQSMLLREIGRREAAESTIAAWRGCQPIPQANVTEMLATLESAGTGKPGTPNTLFAMVGEVCARLTAAEGDAGRMREALRLFVDNTAPVTRGMEGEHGFIASDAHCPACDAEAPTIAELEHETDCWWLMGTASLAPLTGHAAGEHALTDADWRAIGLAGYEAEYPGSVCPNPSNWTDYAKAIFLHRTSTGFGYVNVLPAMRAEYARRAPIVAPPQLTGNSGSLPAPPRCVDVRCYSLNREHVVAPGCPAFVGDTSLPAPLPVDERPMLADWELDGSWRSMKIAGIDDVRINVGGAGSRWWFIIFDAAGDDVGRSDDENPPTSEESAKSAALAHPARIARYRLPGEKAP